MFGYSQRPDPSSQVKTSQLNEQLRNSKTYQDNNIFGYKNQSSPTITAEAKAAASRTRSTTRRFEDSVSGLLQINTNVENDNKSRLKKAPIQKFEPSDNMTSQKRHIQEFHGELAAKRYDRSPIHRRNPPPFSTHEEVPETTPLGRVQYDQTSNIFGNQDRKVSGQREDNQIKSHVTTKNNWNDNQSQRKNANLKENENMSSLDKTNYANNRARTELDSDIFNKQSREQNRNVVSYKEESPKKNPLDREFADRTNENVRRDQHQFSDLMNHEDKNYNYPKTRSPQKHQRLDEPAPSKLSATPILKDRLDQSSHQEQQSQPQIPLNPSPRKQKEAYVLERLEYINKSPYQDRQRQLENEIEKNTPREKRVDNIYRSKTLPWQESPQHARFMQQKPEKKNESSVYQFSLSKIPQNLDYQALRKAFTGHHMMELTTDVDQLNGQFKGSGNVKIKTHDSREIQQLENKLSKYGIEMKQYEQQVKKKSNYSNYAMVNWDDQNLQKEERRYKNREINAYQSRVKNLQSQGDVFGNSKGVGQWDVSPSRPKTSVHGQQNTLEDHVQTLNWKNQVSQVPNTKYSEVQPTYHFTSYTGCNSNSRPKTPF